MEKNQDKGLVYCYQISILSKYISKLNEYLNDAIEGEAIRRGQYWCP